jgi:hypothetical protein
MMCLLFVSANDFNVYPFNFRLGASLLYIGHRSRLPHLPPSAPGYSSCATNFRQPLAQSPTHSLHDTGLEIPGKCR